MRSLKSRSFERSRCCSPTGARIKVGNERDRPAVDNPDTYPSILFGFSLVVSIICWKMHEDCRRPYGDAEAISKELPSVVFMPE